MSSRHGQEYNFELIDGNKDIDVIFNLIRQKPRLLLGEIRTYLANKLHGKGT